MSAYIPTNVISITDGQIYLETDLFYAGVRPAVNVGISVSRVGRQGPDRAMRRSRASCSSSWPQFRELAAFAQFASDLDRATRAQLERGLRIAGSPEAAAVPADSLAQQVTIIYAVTNGFLTTCRSKRCEPGRTSSIASWRAPIPRSRRDHRKEGL